MVRPMSQDGRGPVEPGICPQTTVMREDPVVGKGESKRKEESLVPSTFKRGKPLRFQGVRSAHNSASESSVFCLENSTHSLLTVFISLFPTCRSFGI